MELVGYATGTLITLFFLGGGGGMVICNFLVGSKCTQRQFGGSLT